MLFLSERFISHSIFFEAILADNRKRFFFIFNKRLAQIKVYFFELCRNFDRSYKNEDYL